MIGLMDQYDAEPERLKVSFTNYGEINSWFDMIPRRGMAFVTYVRLLQRDTVNY